MYFKARTVITDTIWRIFFNIPYCTFITGNPSGELDRVPVGTPGGVPGIHQRHVVDKSNILTAIIINARLYALYIKYRIPFSI